MVGTVRQLRARVAAAANARDVKLRVMDEVGGALGASATGLYLFGPDGDIAELHARGVREGFILAYEQLGRGHDPILERALATGAAAHDAEVFRDDGWPRSPLYRECGGPWKIRHYLCAPIIAGGAIVGTLNLGRASELHPFADDDVAAATALGALIGERLAALAAPAAPANDSGGPAAADVVSIESLGQLSAQRTQIRMHAAALERPDLALDADAAGALWDAVIARHVTPLDYFESGDRTYVLLPAGDAAGADATPRAGVLTRREAQIVGRAAVGLANKEIAFELGISSNTVGAALLAARKKLGARSRMKLVEAARRLGLA